MLNYQRVYTYIYIYTHVFDLHQHLQHTKQAADDAADRLVPASTDHLGEVTFSRLKTFGERPLENDLGYDIHYICLSTIYIIYIYIMIYIYVMYTV